MEQTKKKKNPADWTICIVFLVLVFGLTIASMVNPVRTFSENENRYLQQMPEFSFESLFDGEYTADYEKFITDQFVARDAWIGIKTKIERLMLKQDINGVYFGKDGYLIEKHDPTKIDKEVADRNAERLAAFLTKYQEVLGAGRVHAMIVPTASEVLSDKLPPFATGFDQETYIEQIKSLSPENSLIDVIDVLKDHASDDVFYRTDHHWTATGAFYAYQEWAKAIGMLPLSKEDFTIETAVDDFYGTLYSKVNTEMAPDEILLYHTDGTYSVEYNMDGKIKDTLYDRDKLNTKDKYAVYLGGNNALVKIKSEVENGRKLMIIKDSYAHCFAPFAANHFEEVYMVDFRYMNMPASQLIEMFGITDVLVLYNAPNYATETNTILIER